MICTYKIGHNIFLKVIDVTRNQQRYLKLDSVVEFFELDEMLTLELNSGEIIVTSYTFLDFEDSVNTTRH